MKGLLQQRLVELDEAGIVASPHALQRLFALVELVENVIIERES